MGPWNECKRARVALPLSFPLLLVVLDRFWKHRQRIRHTFPDVSSLNEFNEPVFFLGLPLPTFCRLAILSNLATKSLS